MTQYIFVDEIDEAIVAADESLDWLDKAYDSINSARNWGIVDIVGGGFFSTMIKRNKMEDASYYMEMARKSLLKFKDELEDIDDASDMDFGGLLSFADYFFDGFLADFFVQNQINDAKYKIEKAIKAVTDIRQRLVAVRNKL